MRRMNNLVTLFTAIFAFFFGSFITTILISVDKCPSRKSGISKLEPHPELFLIILIMSAPKNIEQRTAMRETWLELAKPLKSSYYPEEFIHLPTYIDEGHLKKESVEDQSKRLHQYIDWMDSIQQYLKTERHIKFKHFFAVGIENLNQNVRMNLEKEQKKNNDMLLLPRLHDTYGNLTEKMLHSIDVLSNYDFSYLLKVDDDTYVKLDNLLNELVSYDRKLLRKAREYHNNPLPQLYWGYFNGYAHIKTRGQWSETNYFLANRYISYALGGGYVLSKKLCDYIYNNSNYLSTYRSEDISMGTWLAPLRHVYRYHDPRFDTAYMPRKCRRYHWVLHKRTPALMHDLHNQKLCSFEENNEQQTQRLREYYYDWYKPADKCCEMLVI